MYRKTSKAYKKRQRELGNPKYVRKHRVSLNPEAIKKRNIKKFKEDEIIPDNFYNTVVHVDEIEAFEKEKNNIKEMKPIKFTKKFMEEFFSEWFKWLKEGTFIEGNGAQLFKSEIPRTTYLQFLEHYERLTGTDVWLSHIDDEFQSDNDEFITYMVEIDRRYEALLEMYSANNKIVATLSKFLFTNKYKHWTDTKRVVNENIIDKFVWHEQKWEDKLLLNAEVVEESPLLLSEYEEIEIEELKPGEKRPMKRIQK